MAEYSYKPISTFWSEIRLVTIKPGPFDADIECELKHVFLDDKPSYEALSYTWGDANDTRSLFLSGLPWDVTANLELALRYLRHKDGTRIMWIDALCINQKDMNERSEQVTNMWEIYTSAAVVVSWLGAPDDDSDVALSDIQYLENIENEIDLLGSSASPLTPATFTRAGIDPAKVDWKAIWALLNRPYWERVWVIQEVATSGVNLLQVNQGGAGDQDRWILVCGSKFIRKKTCEVFCSIFYMMTDMATFRDETEGVLLEPARSMHWGVPAAIHMVKFCDSSGKDLVSLLDDSAIFKATDPRDKVYALLNLAHDGDALLSPDYSKPAALVFNGKATIYFALSKAAKAAEI